MKRAAFLLGVATLVAALPARANEELAKSTAALPVTPWTRSWSALLQGGRRQVPRDKAAEAS